MVPLFDSCIFSCHHGNNALSIPETATRISNRGYEHLRTDLDLRRRANQLPILFRKETYDQTSFAKSSRTAVIEMG